MNSLLLIHADRHAAAPIIAQLRALGFDVAHQLTAAEGIDHAFAHRPDVIVLQGQLGAGLSARETGSAILRAFDVPIVYLDRVPPSALTEGRGISRPSVAR